MSPDHPDRRGVLAAGAALAGGLSMTATAQANDPVVPSLRLVFTARVQIDRLRVIGPIPGGEGRVVPITGGDFEGPNIRGKVMAGGADWQTVRPDGVTELAAHYGLETDDGAIIQVQNNVVIAPMGEVRLARSTLRFSAPGGLHDWLNKRVFVGTINAPGDDRAPVVIRCFEVL